MKHRRSSNKTCAQKKISKVMREGYHGLLHSGSKHGKLVTSRAQMAAIAYSEAKKHCT